MPTNNQWFLWCVGRNRNLTIYEQIQSVVGQIAHPL